MKSSMGAILKWLSLAAGVLVCSMVLSFGIFYMSIRAKELPLNTARDFIRLEEGDEVLHAYTGLRWLDSQRYFVVKADPAGFDARIAKLSSVPPSKDGAPPERSARVASGPGKDLWYRSESVPAWWDVDALENAVAVDVTPFGDSQNGSLSIFSKERGLIYILDR